MKLQIDTKSYKDKESAKDDISIIKKRIQSSPPCDLSVNELANKISHGYCFSPAVLKGGFKAGNWTKQQVFCVDIDNDIKKAPILGGDAALSICEAKNILPAFYYFTYSHSEKKPMFRLVFICNEVIIENSKRKIIMDCLISLFPQCDTACKNADRVFFGTDKDVQLYRPEARFSFNDLMSAYTPPENSIKETKFPDNMNNELDKLKREFDLFGYMKERNGQIMREGDNYIMFENCELCKHKEDLVYYKNTKSFRCFGSNCNKGGSIIDYLMLSQKMNVGEAIRYFKHELCGLPLTDFVVTEFNSPVSRQPYDKEYQFKLKHLHELNEYTRDDKGTGELFADIYKDKCRYNTTNKEWYIYNGKVWIIDPEGMQVSRYAKKLVDELLQYYMTIHNEELKSVCFKYATNLRKLKWRETFIKDARDKYYISANHFDRNDNLLNCLNGTFNLETYKLREHKASDFLSKISNIVYDPTAQSNDFEKFINEIMISDVEKIDFIQRILGYALTTDTSQETCYIFYGNSTRNGKSTLVETIGHMLGGSSGYASTINPESLALNTRRDGRQANEDIARLKGARFVNMKEPSMNMILDVGLLKGLLGRDTQVARYLYKSFGEFQPKFKLIINTNHLPTIQDDTLFASGRITVIPFDRHFSEDEQDKNLKDRLKEPANISGIFNWCVEGLKKNRIKTREQLPLSVIEATSYYRGKSDIIKLFCDECLTPADSNVKALDVYGEYLYYCASKNWGSLSKINFFSSLRARNLMKNSGTVDGNSYYNVVTGYKFIEPRFSERCGKQLSFIDGKSVNV